MQTRSDVRLGSDEGGAIRSDAVLPVQFFRRRGSWQPERGLLLAVVENAVDTYRAHFGATDRRGQRLFDEAEEWLMSTDTTWPFAFESICDVLDLDPDYVRRRLATWAERQLARGGRHMRPDVIQPRIHEQQRAVGD